VNLEITDLQRVNLQPGDRLVVRARHRLSAREAADIVARLCEWSGGQVPVLVLDDSASLDVVTADGGMQEIVR
jgi:hypothetical protein